jgi:hypothetical protein
VTEFKSFNLFLNRMAKKKTTQGIGYINNRSEFDNLVLSVTNVIVQEFNRTSDNATAINNVKRIIDNLVGRTRQNYTKTDVYQVSYLIFYPILKGLAGNENRTFKETQVNTLVAKLMTEGEYGNPSVVRRQTTSAKLTELRTRLFPSLTGGIEAFSNYVFYSLSGAQQRDLNSVAQRMAVRGSRSTTTTRVSNRTRRTTTPRSTTPRATTPAAAPSQVTESSSPVNATFVVVERQVRQLNVDTSEGKKLLLLKVMVYFKLVAREKINPLVASTPNTQLNNVNLRQIMSDTFIPLQAMRPEGTKDIRHCIELISYGLYGNRINQAKRILPYQQWRSQSTGYFSRAYINNLSREYRYNTIMGNAFVNFFNPTISISYFITRMVRFSDTNRYPVTELQQILGTARDIVEMYVPGSSVSTSAPTQTFRQTEAISTSQLERNSTPTQVEVRATPDTAVTDLVKEAKFKNTLGIEIEYQEVTFGEMKEGLKKAKIDLYPRYLRYHESVDYDKYKQWRIMHDGSVKNRFGREYPLNVYGASSSSQKDIKFGELVSPILVGEKGLLQLIRALNTMTKLGATNNQSTGLHIHLGIKDTNQPFGITYKGLRNFIVNYIGFEKIIDSYTRKSRRQNNHRQYTPSPILDIWRTKNLGDGRIADVSYSELEDLSRKLNAYDDTEFRSWAVNTLQRGKLNPHSNGLKFSFEIRQHGGTIERDTIMGWVLFMHYLCVFSEKKISTRFTWKNLSENILPKPLASFWENRIGDMSGEAMDWNRDSWRNLPDIFDGPVKR